VTILNASWEWPAGRNIQYELLVKVKTIQALQGGLFGIRQSPSLVQSLPDPVRVSGLIIKSDSGNVGSTIQLVVPVAEIESIEEGEHALFGFCNDTICISILPMQSE